MIDNDHLGPIDYLAIQFPDGFVPAEGFSELRAQIDAGTLFVLDIEFIRRGEDGSLSTVAASTIGTDLAGLHGADSGLLDRDDIELVGAGLGPGGVLLVIVYENLVLNPALVAWEKAGAQIVAEGPVDVDDLEAALSA